MKGIFKKFFMLTLLMVSGLAISSCGDDNDLNGFWATPAEHYYEGNMIRVYEFINNNTVKYYTCWDNLTAVNSDYKPLTIGGKRWYYSTSDFRTYTYTYKDNKVIIPMQGVILTLSGNTLAQDGSNQIFTKK